MDGVLVIAATNIPWDLDSAIRRRFEKRIYIPLPDAQARFDLISKAFADTPNSIDPADIQTLALATEGFSGADLSIFVRDAVMQPVRECQSASHFSKDRDGMFTPCAPSASAAQKMTMIQVPASGTLSSRHTRAVFCVLHIIPARMFCQMQSLTCDVDCSSQVPSYHFPPLSTSMPRFFGILSALFITTQWHKVRPNMIKCTGSAQLQAVRQPFRPRQVCASVCLFQSKPLTLKTHS
jgi:SpoVK/Ycf46/Vps4 family AAA+-type ATPase